MRQKRLLKLFVNFSRKNNRQLRTTIVAIKGRFRFVIPVLLLALVIVLLNKLLTINKINCFLNHGSCPDEVVSVLKHLSGTNSLFVNQKELISQVKEVFPIDKLTVKYQVFNTIEVNLFGTTQPIPTDVFLINDPPVFSMDQAPSTTDSAGWWVKPTSELETYLKYQESLGFQLWENGSMTPVASEGGAIKYLILDKPDPNLVSSIYKLVKVINKYLEVSQIYIFGSRCFLSRQGQPDIIVSVPFDEDGLVFALQTLNYLTTIKKDTRVIDLSFKNPIIR
jgi:hypothetical protein